MEEAELLDGSAAPRAVPLAIGASDIDPSVSSAVAPVSYGV